MQIEFLRRSCHLRKMTPLPEFTERDSCLGKDLDVIDYIVRLRPCFS